jgi:PPOX class probable F420-dependent enzyme
MSTMRKDERETFLATPRLGILATLRDDRAPIAVPVWFEWDGTVVRMFTGAASPKTRRIERDARASLLVTNAVGEDEAWVAFDGTIAASVDGAIELAERLADRYWDMTDAGHGAAVDGWRATAGQLRTLTLTPAAVRTSRG